MRFFLPLLILLFCVHLQVERDCGRGPASNGSLTSQENLCQAHFDPASLRQPHDSRNWLVQHYLERDFTTVQERGDFIRFTKTSKTEDGNIFFTIELSNLRELNTQLKDKNLVTSIANKHKEIIETLLGQMERQWKLVSNTRRYSDYKSYQGAKPSFTNSPEVRLKFEEDLAIRFAAANQIFSTFLIEKNLIRKTDQPHDWFRGGIGHSLLEANLAARVSRKLSGPNEIRNFASPEIQEYLNDAFKWSTQFAAEVSNKLNFPELYEERTDGIPLFNLKVFEFLRKVDDEEGFRKSMVSYFAYQNEAKAKKLNNALTSDVIEKLKIYKELIDTYSPPVLSDVRMIASLEAAEQGGVSADFIGLGAMNLQATAEALLISHSVDQAVRNAQLGEEKVTKKFRAHLELLRAVMSRHYTKMLDSGDDFVAIASVPLTSRQKQALMNEIANQTGDARMRIAFLNAGAVREDRNLIVAHGEELEKKLKLEALGHIDPKRLDEFVIGIDMLSERAGVGHVKLIVGSTRNRPITQTEYSTLQYALTIAIERFNSETRPTTRPTHYAP